MSQPKKPLIVVAGPTASGKTALAVMLALAFDGEVISADSMQVYKGLQIATARPTEEEMHGIPHHLLGHVSPDTAYNVARYAEEARTAINNVYSRKKQPILCGGTGLYIAAVTDHVQYEQQDDGRAQSVRARLARDLQDCGEQAMWDKLNAVDPALAVKLHPNNRGRILRALEVYELTGIPMSEQQRRQTAEACPYDVKMLVLDFHDRQILYNRIDRRVDDMLAKGLLEETARIVRSDLPTAMQAIGCKELRPYFDAECTLSQAIEQMKRRSRQYAKRQLSWFRRLDTAIRLYVDDYTDQDALLAAALQCLQ